MSAKTAFPLFKLPAEIRNEIYSLVLGGNTIHVLYKYYKTPVNPKLSHIFSDISRYDDKGNKDFLNLPLVCKQMASETLPILYSQNTFKFSNTEPLSAFANPKNAATKSSTHRNLRSVRSVSIEWCKYIDHDDWTSSFLALTINCPQIRTLNISLGLYFCEVNLREVSRFCHTRELPRREEQLLTLANLPLQKCSVELEISQICGSSNIWSEKERQIWTTKLEKRLLEPTPVSTIAESGPAEHNRKRKRTSEDTNPDPRVVKKRVIKPARRQTWSEKVRRITSKRG